LWPTVSTSVVTLVFPAFQCAMATRSGSGSRGGGSQNRGDGAHVADLMESLNLTKDEEEVVVFRDEEEDGGSGGSLEFALTGKVLSPTTLHILMTTLAMMPAWGNPFGLRLRSVGEKADNLFIAEFGCLADKQKVLEGSPWLGFWWICSNPYRGASCSKKINLLYHRNGLQFSMKIFPSSVSLVG
jgi:hypothetical protein